LETTDSRRCAVQCKFHAQCNRCDSEQRLAPGREALQSTGCKVGRQVAAGPPDRARGHCEPARELGKARPTEDWPSRIPRAGTGSASVEVEGYLREGAIRYLSVKPL